jgi:hypothetical protein
LTAPTVGANRLLAVKDRTFRVLETSVLHARFRRLLGEQ